MVISVRIEVACLGSADAERGHGDQSQHGDGRNLKQLVHRGSPVFIQVLTGRGGLTRLSVSGDLINFHDGSSTGLIISLANFSAFLMSLRIEQEESLIV
jgi:hypothetical protein